MDAVFWNNVFDNRINSIPPEEYLIEKKHLLYGKTVLDLGAGDGRNSIYLNEIGYHVTAIDFSETGLHKIKEISSNVVTVLMDINNETELSKIGSFDNIILNHFIPDQKSIQLLPDLLNANGVLLLVAFDKIMEQKRKNTKNLIIGNEQIESLKDSMDIIHIDQVNDDRGIFNRCLLKKRKI
ncbi:class I SAM-dependent methyltransferase [Spirochaeta isovalerica]|uniref:SAM-dependent methyltransferase n=1 Tax=Spirochaeta isovalerica TaxID=150 RepID=A0A841RJ39_9SPIO|nr:methyltransferase domain-containing protein [Spirochaeta isovalerica]MBB6482729.1 SAM-dependent methyltransferase [Spirochaeta isovalerica]